MQTNHHPVGINRAIHQIPEFEIQEIVPQQAPRMSEIARGVFEAYCEDIAKPEHSSLVHGNYTITEANLHEVNKNLKQRILQGCSVGAYEKLNALYPEGYDVPTSKLVTRDLYHCWMETFTEYQTTLTALQNLGCLSTREYAEIAYEVRHAARLHAREQMADRRAVEVVEARDLATYGHKNGPTFQLLYQRGIDRNLPEETAYRRIIDSSTKTNRIADTFIEIVRIFPVLDTLISFD